MFDKLPCVLHTCVEMSHVSSPLTLVPQVIASLPGAAGAWCHHVL